MYKPDGSITKCSSPGTLRFGTDTEKSFGSAMKYPGLVFMNMRVVIPMLKGVGSRYLVAQREVDEKCRQEQLMRQSSKLPNPFKSLFSNKSITESPHVLSSSSFHICGAGLSRGALLAPRLHKGVSNKD